MTSFSCTSGTQHELLDQLSQQFLAQWRNGEAPDVEEYARSYPELANDIRDLFPAIIFAERLHAEATNRNLPNPIHQAMQLGPFRLQREIGSGGMGIVYEATQSPFTQKFAVKVLKQKTIKSSMLESRFAREAQAASRLHHPNIVPAKYYGTEGNQNFLVMPMIDGTSLDKLLSADPNVNPKLHSLFEDICNDWKRIAEIGAQVASALSHAHSHGMIHRDIKPANLILARDGNVWVTDFGLAKIWDDDSDLSRTGEMIGTPRFMAPEQAIGASDERSDIYGVGLTLYDLVTRKCQEHGATIADAWSKQGPNSEDVVRPSSSTLEFPDLRKLNPSVPKQLASVIMKAIAHHPEDRYQTASELEYALNELCYRGTSDRRNSPRTRATVSHYQARNVAVMIATFIVLATTALLLKPTLDATASVPAVPTTPPHDQYIHPPTHFIAFDEPGTDFVNATVMVSSRADDAEEYGEGTMYLDSRDLEMTWDEVDQVIGLRFAGVEIAAGAEIHSAKLAFYAERNDSIETQLQIFGVDEANPVSFRPLDFDISNRPVLPHPIAWNPELWKCGNLYQSPECKEIVQTIIDSPDWQSGNAIAFVIKGQGCRVATTYDGNFHYAPMLKILYRKQTSVGSNGT